MTRRWFSIALVALIPAIYVAAFLAMAWVRSEQGHDEQAATSEIEALAIHQGPADPLADARKRARPVYQRYCEICHGERGRGDGRNATLLQPRPWNFSDPKSWQQTTDERVYYAIAQGGPSVGKSVLMPAWRHTLSPSQIRDLVILLRAFAAPPEAGRK